MATDRISIRDAHPDEAEAIGTLTEAVYRAEGFTDGGWYSAELLDAAGRIAGGRVLVAEVDGLVAGTVTLAPPGSPFAEITDGTELEVRMLATVEHARRLGVADRLMDGAEADARERSLLGVVLSTEPAMQGAHRLYERRGYVRRPDRDWHHDGYDLLVYALDLTAPVAGGEPGFPPAGDDD